MVSSFNDKESALARIYATSLLGLAEKSGLGDQVLAELQELKSLVEGQPELQRFLASPLVESNARSTAIEHMFRGRVLDLIVDALQVIGRKDRLGLLLAIIEEYRSVYEEARGRVVVLVRSAVPLDESARGTLREVVRTRTGREPKLSETVDDSLIGGLELRIGDMKFDGSVVTRLRGVAHLLADRASREIHQGRSYFEESAG